MCSKQKYNTQTFNKKKYVGNRTSISLWINIIIWYFANQYIFVHNTRLCLRKVYEFIYLKPTWKVKIFFFSFFYVTMFYLKTIYYQVRTPTVHIVNINMVDQHECCYYTNLLEYACFYNKWLSFSHFFSYNYN